MSYLSILSLFTLIMVVYVIQTETENVTSRIATETDKVTAEIAIETAKQKMVVEPYFQAGNTTMCAQKAVDTNRTRLEDLFDEYKNFAIHVQNTLNASHRHDAITALQTVYDVRL